MITYHRAEPFAQSEAEKSAVTAECLEQIRKAKVYCVENLKKLREENTQKRK